MLEYACAPDYDYSVNWRVREACETSFDSPPPKARQLKSPAVAGVTQLVECDLAKVDVAGSNPVSRSMLKVSDPETWVTECT